LIFWIDSAATAARSAELHFLQFSPSPENRWERLVIFGGQLAKDIGSFPIQFRHACRLIWIWSLGDAVHLGFDFGQSLRKYVPAFYC
jgi:hypothetical protein